MRKIYKVLLAVCLIICIMMSNIVSLASGILSLINTNNLLLAEVSDASGFYKPEKDKDYELITNGYNRIKLFYSATERNFYGSGNDSNIEVWRSYPSNTTKNIDDICAGWCMSKGGRLSSYGVGYGSNVIIKKSLNAYDDSQIENLINDKSGYKLLLDNVFRLGYTVTDTTEGVQTGVVQEEEGTDGYISKQNRRESAAEEAYYKQNFKRIIEAYCAESGETSDIDISNYENDKLFRVEQYAFWTVTKNQETYKIPSDANELNIADNILYKALVWYIQKNKDYESTGEKTVEINKSNATEQIINNELVIGPFNTTGSIGLVSLNWNVTVDGQQKQAKVYRDKNCTTEIRNYTQELPNGTTNNNYYEYDDEEFYIKVPDVSNYKGLKVDITSNTYNTYGYYYITAMDDGSTNSYRAIDEDGTGQVLQPFLRISRQPVETTTTYENSKSGSFNFKLIKQDGNGKPLSGAQFKITIKDKEGTVLKDKDNNEIKEKIYDVDANGEINIEGFNIESAGKEYTITIHEERAPDGYIAAEDKTITATSTEENGAFKLTKKTEDNVVIENNLIKVTIKNMPEIPDEPEIHKGVKSIENQDSGYYGDEENDWVIQSTVPKGIGKFKKYVITDKIDENLVFSGLDKVAVKIGDKVLLKDTDYKIEYNEETKILAITFIDENFTAGQSMPENSIIETRFKTTFAKDEDGNIKALNTAIPNKAELIYDNGTGEKIKESEKPEVHTGAVAIYKYNEKTKVALEGAKFKIATSKENAQKGEFIKDSTGKDLEATSNEKGIATFEGLEFGGDAKDNESNKTTDKTTGSEVYKYDFDKVSSKYWIVETEAPEGFLLTNEIIEVEISKNTELKEIENMYSIADNPITYADLALRKFITKVDDREVTDREPNVDISCLVDKTDTTAKYTHTKEPVLVAQSQIITYTIRVYNEGTMDAYASLIKDDIPDGLEFVTYTEGDGSINDTYRWKLVDENDNEVTDISKAKYVVTDYLAMDEDEKNLIKGFDQDTMDDLDYRDVQVQFKVVEPTTSDRILINYAQISEETDRNGNKVTDRDSTPNEWKNEDDEDIEKVRVLYFDLALRKWVTQAIVTENGQTVVTETGHKAEDNPETVVKVDLKKSKLNNVTVKFRYSIRITNEGEIAGEATEIRDDIPNGLKFVAEDNPDWREEDGQIVTNKLANITLQPGESAEVEIVLTWVNSEDNMGEMVNTAEINKDHNEYGAPDIDSTPGNNVPGEDDIDDAPVMLTIRTGSEILMYTSLALGVIAIIGAGVVLIKRKVLIG